jgi:hypothetical protein
VQQPQANRRKWVNHMHPDEEATIRAFMAPASRRRWLERMSSPKTRTKQLQQLNHCTELDERFLSKFAYFTDVLPELRRLGAPAMCYVISSAGEIDGREMPLDEAFEAAERYAFGTIISCIPGRLAYYLDECGERRMLLHRPDTSHE